METRNAIKNKEERGNEEGRKERRRKWEKTKNAVKNKEERDKGDGKKEGRRK